MQVHARPCWGFINGVRKNTSLFMKNEWGGKESTSSMQLDLLKITQVDVRNKCKLLDFALPFSFLFKYSLSVGGGFGKWGKEASPSIEWCGSSFFSRENMTDSNPYFFFVCASRINELTTRDFSWREGENNSRISTRSNGRNLTYSCYCLVPA